MHNPPQRKDRLPRSIPYLVANEAAERFSFFGMKAVLLVFLMKGLTTATGAPDNMGETESKVVFHAFLTAVYAAPLAGALLADTVLGRYRTIIALSLVYCAGHAALAIDHTRTGLTLGLALIAMGAGGIKPCVSANIGDQIPHASPLTHRIYSWFYFSINAGAFASMALTPLIMREYGPSTAFAIPGLFMLAATATFYRGRRQYVIKPPTPGKIISDIRKPAVRHQIASLAIIYALMSVFWSLYDQMGSSLLLQAASMDRTIARTTILPAQVQALNPLLVILFIPLVTYVAYPAISRVTTITDSRKITAGMAMAAAAFAMAVLIQRQIDAGTTPHITLQLPIYTMLTLAEVILSVTCLEISYTKAPESMKSIIMALFMLSIAAGNLITALVNAVLPLMAKAPPTGQAYYYMFFSAFMAATTLTFAIISKRVLRPIETEKS